MSPGQEGLASRRSRCPGRPLQFSTGALGPCSVGSVDPLPLTGRLGCIHPPAASRRNPARPRGLAGALVSGAEEAKKKKHEARGTLQPRWEDSPQPWGTSPGTPPGACGKEVDKHKPHVGHRGSHSREGNSTQTPAPGGPGHETPSVDADHKAEPARGAGVTEPADGETEAPSMVGQLL